MFLAVCYLGLQRVLQLVGLLFRSREFKDLEIVVLRHEFFSEVLGGLRPRSVAPLAGRQDHVVRDL